MNSTKITVIACIVFLLVVIGFAMFSGSNKVTKGAELIPFAQCLKDKGAQFYGAFWCPHCQAQKALFGSATKYLPYVECSTPDGNSQLPVCTSKGVQQYPTWFFADGTSHVGEMSLADLSAKTSCSLQVGTSTSTTATTTSTSTSSAAK